MENATVILDESTYAKNNTNDSFGSNFTYNNFKNTTAVSLDNKHYELALDVVTFIAMLLIMIAMGTDVSWKQIWKHIRTPFGPIIGLLCQFVLMPFLGFIYNKIFHFKPDIATGLLIISCCPGGALSNIFTYYMDGDVTLSVTMTTISVLAALGLMPLNIWIYANNRQTNGIIIPYKNIALSLVKIISPVILGMIIRWKAPNVSAYIKRWGSAVGLMLIAVAVVLQCMVSQQVLHEISWKLILTATFMPLTAIFISFFIAFICRQPYSICKTIAVESSTQNAPVAFSVVLLSFDIKKYASLLFIPWFYGINQTLIGIFLCFIQYLTNYKLKKVFETKC